MTIKGWAVFGGVAVCVIVFAIVAFLFVNENMVRSKKRIFTSLGVVLVAGSLIIGAFAGLHWYYTETAEGRRAVIDQQSNINNGLERTINILNADGEVIRTYTGVIDIEGNDGGYVVFDYNGRRYTYYNCYLESIADIELAKTLVHSSSAFRQGGESARKMKGHTLWKK